MFGLICSLSLDVEFKHPKSSNNCNFTKQLFTTLQIRLLIYTLHPVSAKCIMQMSLVLQAQSTNGIHFRLQRNMAMSK
ncbi:unnamed protein product [Gulo gulo]|uniref:Uncharacterized protein n=1 Tax=Gulo gulo TaxID=48420 RepID=A0A9X9LZY7_GULGU|nr:unnamed protein product [Gulo gulo]